MLFVDRYLSLVRGDLFVCYVMLQHPLVNCSKVVNLRVIAVSLELVPRFSGLDEMTKRLKSRFHF
jgi:hypothetical protein